MFLNLYNVLVQGLLVVREFCLERLPLLLGGCELVSKLLIFTLLDGHLPLQILNQGDVLRTQGFHLIYKAELRFYTLEKSTRSGFTTETAPRYTFEPPTLIRQVSSWKATFMR